MFTVIEPPIFQKYASEIWTDDERMAFVNWISANPDAGEVIQGTGGLRKVRWARSGMGKRGGARVIYFVRRANGDIVLVVAYAKAKFDNMPASVLKTWKDLIDANYQ